MRRPNRSLRLCGMRCCVLLTAIVLLSPAPGCGPEARTEPAAFAGRHGVLIAGRGPVRVHDPGGAVLAGVGVPEGLWIPCETGIARTFGVTGSRGAVRTVKAAAAPAAVVLADVPLGGASAHETGFSSEDIARFSPDGTLLAAGTEDGFVRVFSVPSMQRIWRTRIAEGAPKSLEFTPDASVLIVAEQSPRGRITAFDVSSGRRSWTRDLADDLGGNASAGADPALARFSLPAAYRLLSMPNGMIVANGVHGWTDDRGTGRNLSRMYCLDPRTGRASWVFPAESPMPVNMVWFDASPDGERIVAAVSAYGVAPPPDGFPHPPGSLLLLDAASGRLLDTARVDPAVAGDEPPGLWRALAFSGDGRRLLSGWLDGQLLIHELHDDRTRFGTPRDLPFGAPRRVGDLTVFAPISLATRVREGFAVVAAQARVPGARGVPPGALHPDQNTFAVIDREGSIRRRWQPPFGRIEAICADREGDWVIVAVAPSETGEAGFLSGVAIAETSSRDAVSTPLTFLSLGGRLSLNPDLSPSGEFAAVVERPLLLPDAATVRGKYRILLFN